MNDRYLEFTIPVMGVSRDMLLAALAEQDFEGFVENDNALSAFIPEKLFNRKVFEDLLFQHEISPNHVNEQIIEQRNWNAEWEASYDAISIGNDIYIKTPFHPEKPEFKYQITIQPKMSFGTGHHETTRLMLQLMLNIDFQTKNVFDYGCGTGVLSVMASVLGANKIFAVDIDDWAASNLHENAELNHINNIEFQQADIKAAQGHQYEIVLANINKNILLQTMNELAQTIAPNGHLLLSGFYQKDVEDLLNAAAPFHLTLNQSVMENEWTALHLIKK